MQTYSHLILAGALNGRLGRLTQKHAKRLPPLRSSALLLGSVIPDLLLIGLSAIAIARDAAAGVFANNDFSAAPPGVPPPPELIEASMTMKLFEVWFFENPWVITAQNLFHSPLLVAIFIGVGYAAWCRDHKWGSWFFWLSCAAMVHTLIDIPLHVTDGPLLLFPLNWTWRFESPLSYWDPNYFGREWSIFEHLLDLGLLFYLAVRYRKPMRVWWQQRLARRTDAVGP